MTSGAAVSRTEPAFTTFLRVTMHGGIALRTLRWAVKDSNYEIYQTKRV